MGESVRRLADAQNDACRQTRGLPVQGPELKKLDTKHSQHHDVHNEQRRNGHSHHEIVVSRRHSKAGSDRGRCRPPRAIADWSLGCGGAEKTQHQRALYAEVEQAHKDHFHQPKLPRPVEEAPTARHRFAADAGKKDSDEQPVAVAPPMMSQCWATWRNNAGSPARQATSRSSGASPTVTKGLQREDKAAARKQRGKTGE
jgi:hypothetical protein